MRKTNQPNVLILGGTKGLGEQISTLHQALRHHVYVVGSSADPDKSNEFVTEMKCDLTDESRMMDFIDQVARLPLINYFYWVAGWLLKGDLHKQTTLQILKAVDINFRNSVPIAAAAWGHMRKDPTRTCYFCVVSSSSGTTPRADEAIYAAAKHAQVGFTRSLGLENLTPQIRVSLVMPGGMKTGLWDRNPNDDFDSFMDPSKVAEKIVDFVLAQQVPYDELKIPRGSL
jgi:NAD(P)-dependent dehydrogenase (short-subunit alcohol dehydrogenase family)